MDSQRQRSLNFGRPSGDCETVATPLWSRYFLSPLGLLNVRRAGGAMDVFGGAASVQLRVEALAAEREHLTVVALQPPAILTGGVGVDLKPCR